MFDAFHLPALRTPPTTTWSYGRGEAAVQLRIPQLSAVLLREQVEALLAARAEHLEGRPVAEVIAAIDRAAARFADPEDELRRSAEAALPAVTGYSAPMVRRILDHMVPDWRAPRLEALLAAEFGDARVLDEFRPRRGVPGQTRAFGPRLATHVFSGNVPGVAVTSLIRSLLVKAATLGKTATGEPLLAALFARALSSVDAGLGACLAVTYWPGGARAMEAVALPSAEVVIAYGGAEAISALRASTPAGVRFIGYGHRLSFGVVARERLGAEEAEAVAKRAALEAATFDQQGCVSPHLFYVEEGGAVSPQEWAALLAGAMARLETVLPRGTLSPSEASAIRQIRGEAEFAELAGSGTELHASGEGTAWTVIYDPDPAFAASCLNRVVRVKPVADLAEVAARVGAVGPLLQSVGVAAGAERARELAESLGRLGASRIAPLGRMAWPPPEWHHDGHPPLAELVRWCDLEA
jgi:hypothetical protein